MMRGNLDVFGGFVAVSTDDTPPEDFELKDAEEIGFRDVVEYLDGDGLVFWSPAEQSCIAYEDENILYYSLQHLAPEYAELLKIIRDRTGCEYGKVG